MNIKIQGGGNSGQYANKGSCIAITNYLQHEDMDRAIEGKGVSPFFNDTLDRVTPTEVTYKIDNNKSQLRKPT